MDEHNVCKLCGGKLKRKESSALYYCIKCSEKDKKKGTIGRY